MIISKIEIDHVLVGILVDSTISTYYSIRPKLTYQQIRRLHRMGYCAVWYVALMYSANFKSTFYGEKKPAGLKFQVLEVKAYIFE